MFAASRDLLRRTMAISVLAVGWLVVSYAQQSEINSVRQAAETAARSGEWSQAASLYRSALASGSESAWAHRGLADVYRANGAWDKAAEEYDALISTAPDDNEARALSSLSHQALNEMRSGFVTAKTLGLLVAIPWSWALTATRDLGSPESPASRIPLQIPFARDRFALNSLPPQAFRQLQEAAAMIGKIYMPPFRIEIEGHTCRCGSESVNLELGRKRAEAVRQFLLDSGVARPEEITTISFGSGRPVDSLGAPSLPAGICERDEIHSRNRRVVILVFGQTRDVQDTELDVKVSFFHRKAGATSYEVLTDGGHVQNGDEYRFRIHTETAAYAYVFHRGSSGAWDILFPKRASSESERLVNPVEADKDISVPTSDHGFTINGEHGTEATYVYSSREPDQHLEDLLAKIGNGDDVKLLPPLLLEPQASVPVASVPGHADRSHNAPAKPSAPASPVVERTEEIEMRDLGHPKPGDADAIKPGWSRLPPKPAAYIRFSH